MGENKYLCGEQLDILSEGILVLNRDGYIVMANDFACGMFELSINDLKGIELTDLMNPDDVESFRLGLLNVKVDEIEFFTLEFISSTAKRFLGNIKLLRTELEEVTYFFCRISDAIIDSDELSEAFPKHAIIKQIIDDGSGAVFIKKKSGSYVYANDIFYQRCEKKIAHVVGCMDWELFHPKDAELFETMDSDVMESKKSKIYYHWSDENSPSKKFYKTVKYPIMNLKKEPVGILGISFDITDGRSRIEGILPEGDRNVSITNSKRIGYVLHELICDSEGTPVDYVFLDMNKTFEELTGLKYQEVIGKRVTEVLPDTEKQWVEFYGNVALTGVSRSYENFSKELGKTYSVEAFQTEPGFFCVLVQDITIMKDTEQQLIAMYEEADIANRTKDHFLMNMSHEIRTPLNGINGVLELMSHTSMDEEQKRYFNLLDSSFKSLTTVLTEIIDYTHMTRAAVELVEDPFNLKELMDEISNLFNAAAMQKGLDFTVVYEECHTPFFIGDRIKLKQLLSNIIGNAIKFTMFGHIRIDIGCSGIATDNDNVRIKITDTGIGMDEKDRDIIFDLFSQKSEGVGKRFNGLGLGLAISSEICKTLGAVMNIESAIGKGTTVELLIPLKRHDAIHSVQGVYETQEQTPYRILVVEDDKVSGLFLEMMLENEGYEVNVVGDGKEALNLLESQPMDLILMDINLPEIDGFETTRLFKSMKPEALMIPVIAISGYVTEENRKKSSEVGMADFVPKPIVKADLINTLTKWL